MNPIVLIVQEEPISGSMDLPFVELHVQMEHINLVINVYYVMPVVEHVMQQHPLIV